MANTPDPHLERLNAYVEAAKASSGRYLDEAMKIQEVIDALEASGAKNLAADFRRFQAAYIEAAETWRDQVENATQMIWSHLESKGYRVTR